MIHNQKHINIYKQIKIGSDEYDGDVYFIYDDIRNRTKIAFYL